MPIAKLLNDAWQAFLANPSAYRRWEKSKIADLAARLLDH